MSKSIKKSLTGGKVGISWTKLLGYNAKDLMNHLKRLFQPGMTWENYGEWHIDHKIPRSVFNFSKPEHVDFKRCWALSNLQPMWAAENIKKGTMFNGSFQPSLEL